MGEPYHPAGTWDASQERRDETDVEFMARVRRENDAGLRNGVKWGWWSAVDWDKREPIPHPKTFKASDYSTLAAAFHAAGMFESIKAAKRAGWNRPAQPGEWKFKRNLFGPVIVHLIE